MADIQDLVDAAVAAALAERARVPPMAQAPRVATFARTPAQANTGLLNYESSEGMKIYNAAIAALPTKYSGNTADMHIFLKNVKERGQSFGWNTILNVPKGDGVKNLIDQYGLLDLNDIKTHALAYENASGRDAQNASQMYNFLYASLSEQAKLMVLSDFSDYTIITNDGFHICNGPCFLKVIIRNTTVDTRSTVFHIRENLSRLDAQMVDINYDIEAFNMYVTTQVEQLAARGESSSDLLINLFAAYMSVPDRKFVEYVEKQKDKFDEGEEVTTKKLMQVALVKYKDRKRSNNWQAPSHEEEQIIALTAQISDLHARQKPTAADKEKKVGKKSDSKKAREAKLNDKYAWKLEAPGSGEPTSKEVNSKMYHFCKNHNSGNGAWVIHHPSKCDKEPKKEKTKQKSDPTLTLSKALRAIHEDGGNTSSDDDE